jgi:hypothetical protein
VGGCYRKLVPFYFGNSETSNPCVRQGYLFIETALQLKWFIIFSKGIFMIGRFIPRFLMVSAAAVVPLKTAQAGSSPTHAKVMKTKLDTKKIYKI